MCKKKKRWLLKEMIIETNSAEETFALGKALGEKASPGQIYTLDGDLGTGKTVFTQGVAAGLGITEAISSPTFTIIQEYDEGRLPLYHFDVYRLEDISELENIGFYEYTEDCVSIVEWADKFPHELPDETLWIYLTRIDDTNRSITLVSDYLTADDLVEIGGPYVVGN